jgi:hypothetical protein
VPDYSVFDIPYAKMEKKLELFNSGVQRVDQVDPATAGLTDKRSIRAVEVARLGRPAIDKKSIADFLGKLVYPISHLDFEAVNPAIPPYDATRPYMAVPTQASIHTQQMLGGPVEHHEFLGDGKKDPRGELIAFLIENLGGTGTVLAYYKSYEGGILKGLASFHHGAAAQLAGMEARLADLADPFSKGWYTHPGFLGKWSLKNVLPVLAPELSYKTLAIQNGAQAMAAYAELMDPKTTPERSAQIKADLKVYCGQDTLAMVRILAHLYEVTAAVKA